MLPSEERKGAFVFTRPLSRHRHGIEDRADDRARNLELPTGLSSFRLAPAAMNVHHAWIGGLLEQSHEVTDSDASFTWVPADFLEEHEVAAWQEMTCWIPAEGEYAGFGSVDVSRALGAWRAAATLPRVSMVPATSLSMFGSMTPKLRLLVVPTRQVSFTRAVTVMGWLSSAMTPASGRPAPITATRARRALE